MTIRGPHGASLDERAAAIELANRVFRMGLDSRTEDEFSLLWRESNADCLRMFTDGGRVVALVGMLLQEVVLLGSRHLAGCIGSVCTDPEYRGQGLATRLLVDAREKALADGADMLLISGKRGLYMRLGYVNVGDYRLCRVNLRRLPPKPRYVVRAWRPEDLPALVRLHMAEPVRFVRPPDDFAVLLRLPGLMSSPGGVCVVCPKGAQEPVAYFALRTEARLGQRKGTDALVLIEMGGSRWAIAGALEALCRELGATRLSIRRLGSDREMAQIAASLGWREEPCGFRGTVGIIAPAPFWAACAPVYCERLGSERAALLSLTDGPRPRIAYGSESVSLDGMAGLTKLVFLPPHRRAELSLGLPDGSELARALDEAFPLPLVDYGLNYV